MMDFIHHYQNNDGEFATSQYFQRYLLIDNYLSFYLIWKTFLTENIQVGNTVLSFGETFGVTYVY